MNLKVAPALNQLVIIIIDNGAAICSQTSQGLTSMSGLHHILLAIAWELARDRLERPFHAKHMMHAAQAARPAKRRNDDLRRRPVARGFVRACSIVAVASLTSDVSSPA
jgi:hypothetical protein